MHFPLLPLIGVFSEFCGLNMWLSGPVFLIAFEVAAVWLMANAHKSNGYNKADARTGLLALGIAIFVAIVGMVYILTFVFAAILSYLLVYWVLYRFLILNIKAAWSKKP